MTLVMSFTLNEIKGDVVVSRDFIRLEESRHKQREKRADKSGLPIR